MAQTKNALIRQRVIDRCLRSPKLYSVNDMMEKCNIALEQAGYKPVTSKVTILKDLEGIENDFPDAVIVKRKSGRRSDDYLAIYSLDRIESIEQLGTKYYCDPSFDAAVFFNECFGVVADGSKPVRIVLRSFGIEQHNMRDLPIHHSPKELKATDSRTDSEVFIRPATDFKAHLMYRGGWLQVVSPKSLAKEILEWHQEAIDRYAKTLLTYGLPFVIKTILQWHDFCSIILCNCCTRDIHILIICWTKMFVVIKKCCNFALSALTATVQCLYETFPRRSAAAVRRACRG